METLQKEQVEGKEELSHPLTAGFQRLWREAEDSIFQENQEGIGASLALNQHHIKSAEIGPQRAFPRGILKVQILQPPYPPGSDFSQHLKKILKMFWYP